jgi:hypothetical protein
MTTDELLADKAADTIDAQAARIAELEAALEQIAVYGCGMLSQPVALNVSETAWLRARLAEYERVARAALKGADR